VILLMALSVTLAIRDDWNAEQKRERELRRKMRQLVS